MKILFLSAYCPLPKGNNAAVVDVFREIEELSKHHQIYLISFASKEEIAGSSFLQDICEEVSLIPLVATPGKVSYKIYNVLSLFSRLPAIALASHSRRFVQAIREWMSLYNFDLVQIEFSQMAHYIEYINGIPAVMDGMDIAFIRRSRFTNNLKAGLIKAILTIDCKKLKEYEINYMKKYNAVLVRSKADQQLLADYIPQQPIEILPPWIDLGKNKVKTASHDKNLIFYGAMWRNVNFEAAKYFINEVLPIIHITEPTVKLFVVGSDPPKELKKMSNSQVVVKGFVDEVGEYYEKSAVAVAPLFAGSGIKGKIIQALSYGRPVVTTAVGAEGIPASEDEGLFIREDAESMAQTILWLLEDYRYKKYFELARNFVAHHYNWPEAMRRVEKLYKELVDNANMRPLRKSLDKY